MSVGLESVGHKWCRVHALTDLKRSYGPDNVLDIAEALIVESTMGNSGSSPPRCSKLTARTATASSTSCARPSGLTSSPCRVRGRSCARGCEIARSSARMMLSSFAPNLYMPGSPGRQATPHPHARSCPLAVLVPQDERANTPPGAQFWMLPLFDQQALAFFVHRFGLGLTPTPSNSIRVPRRSDRSRGLTQAR